MKEVYIDESKSFVNRCLILESFSETLKLNFRTQASDVISLKRALDDFRAGKKEFFLTEGGTSFRFLAARLSRQSGEFKVFAAKHLLDRPHDGLIKALERLGILVSLESDHLKIISKGWMGKTVEIDCSKSTQFLSAIVLSSIDLQEDFQIIIKNLAVNRPYFLMTLKSLEDFGVQFQLKNDVLIIFKNRDRSQENFYLEPDMSSCFSICGVRLLSNGIKIKNFNSQSLQGDLFFLEIFKQMRINFSINSQENELTVFPSSNLHGVDVNISDCLDLLPVLGALCFFSKETSIIRGVANCRFKETDRVLELKNLLELAGRRVEVFLDEIHILEKNLDHNLAQSFIFDVSHDHRMCFAATVLKTGGVKLEIKGKDSVNKSFPSFWELIA